MVGTEIGVIEEYTMENTVDTGILLPGGVLISEKRIV